MLKEFNAGLATLITKAVGSMWCAYIFTLLALVSLPEAIHGGKATLIAWIAQTFLQLVLLSVIMVGQDVNSSNAEARAKSIYEKTEARAEADHIMILEEFKMLNESLTELSEIQDEMREIVKNTPKYL